MGQEYNMHRFTYLPRQTGTNGRIKNYELYVSKDRFNWGAAVKTGSFENSAAPQTITFATPVTGRYFKLKALSEVNGNPWASVAELSVVGCYAGITAINDVADPFGDPLTDRFGNPLADHLNPGDTERNGVPAYADGIHDLRAWPVPTSGKVTIPLPSGQAMEYRVVTLQGHLVASGNTAGFNPGISPPFPATLQAQLLMHLTPPPAKPPLSPIPPSSTSPPWHPAFTW